MEDSWVKWFTNQPTTKDMNFNDFQRAEIRAFHQPSTENAVQQDWRSPKNERKNSPNNQFSGSILSFGGV